MKYLLIALLFLIGCDKEMGGKYTGRIVRMQYNYYDHMNNDVDVLTGSDEKTDTKRIHNCPKFDDLKPGDFVVVECTPGYFPTCYITSKVVIEE